jgi:hypothetical protein
LCVGWQLPAIQLSLEPASSSGRRPFSPAYGTSIRAKRANLYYPDSRTILRKRGSGGIFPESRASDVEAAGAKYIRASLRPKLADSSEPRESNERDAGACCRWLYKWSI